MKLGYLVLSRKLFKSFLWEEKREYSRFEAFIYLVYHAQYGKEPRKVSIKNKILIQNRGELLRSQRRLAEDWGWTPKRVNAWLKTMTKNGSIVNVNETVTTRITICNYDKYQDLGNYRETQTKPEGNGNETETKRKGQLKNTSKSSKASKEETMWPYPDNYSEKLKTTFNEFIKNRIALKKPVTDRAFTGLLNKLDKLSCGNELFALEILENSIVGGWSGLFELKNKPAQQQEQIYATLNR